PGTPVLAGERPVGELGTVSGADGLALVRIDKVKDAMDAGQTITAGDVAILLTIPPGAGFGFPETAGGDGE
ncbi:MAG: folate-binding protein, partial [Rhizobiaceae bacterium]